MHRLNSLLFQGQCSQQASPAQCTVAFVFPCQRVTLGWLDGNGGGRGRMPRGRQQGACLTLTQPTFSNRTPRSIEIWSLCHISLASTNFERICSC